MNLLITFIACLVATAIGYYIGFEKGSKAAALNFINSLKNAKSKSNPND